MKLSTPLIALALASTTLASVIPQKRDIGDISIDDVPAFQNTCAIELFEKNKECFLELNSIDQIEAKCNAYKTDKCKKFFSTVIDDLTKCEAIDQGRLTAVNISIDKTKKYLDSLCAMDENKKLCPITSALAGEIDATAYNNAINNSCKSKSCTENGATFLELNLSSAGVSTNNDIKFDKEFNVNDAKSQNIDNDAYALAFLRSDYCNNQHPQSSDATALSTSLLLTFIVLCFALF